MKTLINEVKLWLLVFTAFVVHPGQAQDKIQNELTKFAQGDKNVSNGRVVRVTFDATSKKIMVINPPNYVGEGGSITIEISNFNPFLYSLSIKEKQGLYQSKENLSEKNFSSIAYNQAFLNMKDISISTISFPIAGSMSIVNDALLGDIKTLKDNIATKNREIQQQFIALRDKTTRADSATVITLIDTKNLEIKELERQLEQKQKELEVTVSRSVNRNDQISLYNKKVNALIDQVNQLNNIPAYYKTLATATMVDGVKYESLNEQKRDNFKAYFPNWIESRSIKLSVHLNSVLAQVHKQYHEIQSYYLDIAGQLQNGTPDEKKKYEELKTSFNDLKSGYEKINFEPFKNMIDAIDKIYSSINEDMFKIVYTTNIIDDDADMIYFELESKPISGTDPTLPIQPIKSSFGIPIRGGVKIDVGSGFAFNFGLFNASYRYNETSPGSGKYRVVENFNRSLFNPGIVVMAHLSRRNATKNHRPIVSVGIGTADAERLRYYLGFGWKFGRKQWMNFTLGAVGGQVDRASETIMNKDLTLTAEDLTKAIPLSDPAPFKIGGFFAITFSLTGSNSIFAQKAANIK